MDKVPVKDKSGFVRDLRTNAVISTNSKALALHKKKKNIRIKNEQEISNLKAENEKLNTKVDELEKQLEKILEKLG